MIAPVSIGVDYVAIQQQRNAEIASGKKSITFNSPATLQIGEKQLIASNLVGMENNNLENQISYNQTKDAFLSNAHGTIARISELTVQAGSGILNATDKAAINTEIAQLTKQLDSDYQHAEFNGNKILQTDDVKDLVNSLHDLDVSNDTDRIAAAEAASDAIEELGSQRAELGAETGILTEQVDANRAYRANLFSSSAKNTNTNMGESITKAATASILGQAAIAVQAQSADLSRRNVATLLAGIA